MHKLNRIETSVLLLVAFIILLVWWFAQGAVSYLSGETDLTKLGQFGDLYGTLSSLFSALALLGVAYSVLLQREELAAAQKGLANQDAASRQQSFEGMFFQLLHFHNELVSAIDLRDSAHNERIIAKGRDCFRTFYADLKNSWINRADLGSGNQLQEINKAYSNFFEHREQDVGHYFRHLYHLIKFVDESPIKDRQKYTNIVRAQLSSFEQLVLFYNCLSKHGHEKFKPLIEKYALLHTISYANLIDEKLHRPLYRESAYGRQSG